jgi:hypothetical protein
MNKLIETYSWIKIFLSLLIISLVLAFLSWLNTSHFVFQVAAVFLVISGIGLGIYFADKVRLLKGTHLFMSEICRSENFDKEFIAAYLSITSNLVSARSPSESESNKMCLPGAGLTII